MASATEVPSTSDETCRLLTATKELDRKTAEWTELQDRVKQAVANAPTMVKLNVGGTTFETSKDTLLRVEGSYFHALLGSGHWKPDDDTTNAYFLDMDPILFRRVLFYLRTGTMMPIDGLTKAEYNELKAMLEYLKVCPRGVATQLIRWSAIKKSPTLTLSDDGRTVDKSTYDRGGGGAMATEALVGKFRLRVDAVGGLFFVGLGPIAGFDCNCLDTAMKHCYRYGSNGCVYKKQSQLVSQAKLQAGDVVTIQRCALEVVFAVNDGAPVQVPLVDPNEALFPVVFMSSVGTKLTVVY